MKTIIAGSRYGVTFKDVLRAVRDCGWKVTGVVSGTALGADTEGEKVAKLLGLPVELHPADWVGQGKKAGVLRNIKMANNAEALIAVWDGKSRGTQHMIRIAKEKGLKVFVHRVQELEIEI